MGDSTRTALQRVLTAAAFTIFPASAFAQAVQNTQLPTIEVTGVPTTQEAVYQTPAAVSTVGEAEIDFFGSQKLDNVLRTLPGVFTRDSVNNPGTSVNIRGFEGSGRVNMMIDGVRQNFRFTGHEAQGFLYVDPQLLAGIDVQRGAVSGPGGAGSLVGTANFRTLDVQDILLPGKSFGALNSLTWGSNGVGLMNMIAGAAYLAPNVSAAAAFSFRNSNPYENGEGQVVPYGGAQDLQSGLMKVNLGLTENSTLRLGYVKYTNNFVSNSYNQDIDADTVTAKYHWKPADNLIDLRINGSVNNVRMHYLDHYNNPGATAIGRIINDRGYGFDISNISRFTMGDVAVRWQYGFETAYDDVTNVKGFVNPQGTGLLGGLFSQTTFSRNIFDLTVGLRYDYAQQKGSGEILNAALFLPLGPYSIDNSYDRLNPKVTLAAKVLPWLQPFITYSESMRVPTINELMVGGNHPGSPGSSTSSYAPNPFLQPEVQKGFELGFNVAHNGVFAPHDQFRFKGLYYRMNVDNYITACFGALVYFCNVSGTSLVDGVELQGSYDAGYAFAALSYTYTHTDLPTQTPGFGASQYLPDHNLVVTLGARFFDRKLTTGIRGYFVSETTAAGFSTTTRQEGYSLYDLFAEYKISPTWAASVTVTNLFDEPYSPVLSTGQTGTFTGSTGNGRTLLLTSKVQF